MRGADLLIRNENCTYDQNFDIANSNCTGNQGTCVAGGFCVCKEGFMGVNDWINLDTYDCQARKSFAMTGISASAFAIATSWFALFISMRVCHRTWKLSQPQDRNLKSLIPKPPIRVSICVAISSLPLLIVAAVKFISPYTIMIDPGEN